MYMRHTINFTLIVVCGQKGAAKVTFRAGRLINCTACETPWEPIEGLFFIILC